MSSSEPLPLVPPLAGQALKQTRVGVRNWLSELGANLDSFDMGQLQWLNHALADVARGLQGRAKQAALDEPAGLARDLPQTPGAAVSADLEKALDALAQVGKRASIGTPVDADLLADVEKIKKELEAVLERAKQKAEQAKVAGVLDALRKSADLLDAAVAGESVQVSEGIDAVLEAAPNTQSELLDRMASVANLFDTEGKTAAADVFDVLISQAADAFDAVPDRWESRKEKYDAAANNAETMWEHVKREVAENRKQHHLETHRDTSPSLSTRYSPEFPGVSMMPVADNVFQDPITRKVYDFNKGFSLPNGEKYPGGSVKNQTPNFSQMTGSGRAFETRQDKQRRSANKQVPLQKSAIKDDGLSGKQSFDDLKEPEKSKDEPLKRRSFERSQEKPESSKKEKEKKD